MREWDKQSSRRNLLLGPFKHFIGGDSYPPADTADKWVETIGELISLAVIAGIAWKGSQDQIVSYNVSSEARIKDAPRFPETLRDLQTFASVIHPLAVQTSRMNSVWTKAYEDEVCNPVVKTTIDSNGNPSTSTSSECHTEWNEPRQLTANGFDHNRLSKWAWFFNDLNQKAGSAISGTPEAFDLTQDGAGIFYQEQAVSGGNQALLAIPVFGLVGGLFCLYEEAAGYFSGGYGDRFIDDRKYVKRRTLFKLAATGLMSLKIRDMQRAFADENKHLLDETKAHTRSVLNQLDVTPEANFRRFFATDPRAIREMVLDVQNASTTAMSSGYLGIFDYGWPAVKGEIGQNITQARTSLGEFDRYFSFNQTSGSYEIPPGLTQATKYLWATNEMMSFAAAKSTQVYTRHLRDALLMDLGLGGLALVGEKGIFPLMDVILAKEAE